jgi:hypothetical protein
MIDGRRFSTGLLLGAAASTISGCAVARLILKAGGQET